MSRHRSNSQYTQGLSTDDDSEEEVMVVSPGNAANRYSSTAGIDHKYEELKVALEKTETDLNAMTINYDKVNAKYQELKGDYKKLLADFEAKVKADQTKLKELNKQLESQKTIQASKAEFKSTFLNSLTERFAFLSDGLDVEAAFTAIEQKVESLTKELHEKEINLVQLQEKQKVESLENSKNLEMAESSNTELSQKVIAYQEKVKSLEEAVETLRKENEKLSSFEREEMKFTETHFLSLKQQNERLLKDIEAHKTLSISADSLKQDVERGEAKIVELERELNKTREENNSTIENLLNDNNELESVNQTLTAEVKNLKHRLEQQSVPKVDASKMVSNEKYEELEAKLSSIAAKLSNKETDNKVLREECASIESINKDLTAKLKSTEEQVQALQTELKLKNASAVKIKKNNSASQQKPKNKLQLFLEETRELSDEGEFIDVEEKTQDDLAQVQEVQALKDENEKLVQALSKIEAEYFVEKEQLNKDKVELRSTLEYVVEENEKLKIEINSVKESYEEAIKEQNETNILVMEKLYDAMRAEQQL